MVPPEALHGHSLPRALAALVAVVDGLVDGLVAAALVGVGIFAVAILLVFLAVLAVVLLAFLAAALLAVLAVALDAAPGVVRRPVGHSREGALERQQVLAGRDGPAGGPRAPVEERDGAAVLVRGRAHAADGGGREFEDAVVGPYVAAGALGEPLAVGFGDLHAERLVLLFERGGAGLEQREAELEPVLQHLQADGGLARHARACAPARGCL